MKRRTLVFLMALVLAFSSVSAFAEIDLSVILSGITRSEMRALGSGIFPAIDKYLAENPDIKLAEESYPDQTAYQQKVYTLAAAGNLPDVYRVKGSWMTEFVQNGWATDLTAVLDADPEWKGMFKEGSFRPFTRDGKIYSIPDESMVTSVVYWNKDLWKQAGYDEFPTKWDDMKAAAAKFQEMGIPMFVMGNKPNWPAESCWFSTIGHRMTGVEWTNSIIAKDGNAKFTDAPFVEALRRFQDLALTPGAFNADINSLAEDQAREVWFAGKAATIVEGTWFIATIQNTKPSFMDNIGITVLPTFDDAVGNINEVSGGPAWSWTLSPNAFASEERYQAALGLLKAMTSAEVHKVATESGCIMSGNVDYDENALGPIMKGFLSMFADKTTVPIYDAFFEGSVIETMNTGIQELLIGTKTPEELAEDIQREQEMVMLG